MAWPPRRAKVWTEAGVSEATLRAYKVVFEKLVNLECEFTENNRSKPKYIGLGSKAKQRWRSFFNSHNVEHLDRFGSLAAASSKIEEIPARLALILHNVKFSTGEITTDQVDAETMQVAITIANWFMAEAERIYEIMAGEGASRAERELVDWIRLRGGSVSAAELAKGSRKYQNGEEAERHLQLLVDIGWGHWENIKPGASGGRPTRRLTLVPVVETPANPEEQDSFDDILHADRQQLDVVDQSGDEVEVLF